MKQCENINIYHLVTIPGIEFGVENSRFYKFVFVLVVFCAKHKKVIVKDFFFFGFANSKSVKKLFRFIYEQKNVVRILIFSNSFFQQRVVEWG
jgi:hypothetical protein